METPKGALELDVYPGDDCRGELYFDDGVTISGPSLRQTIQCSVTANGVALRFGPREGSWRPWWKQIAVTVHGTHVTRKLIPDQAHKAEVLIP
jgi:alpha-glucosidase